MRLLVVEQQPDAPAGLVMDTVGGGCAATGPVHVVPLMVKTVGAVLVPL